MDGSNGRAPVRMATMSDVLAIGKGGATARDVGLTLNRIYFLDLKAVRQTLGHNRWLAKRAVVHGVTKACIRQAAGLEDVCVQLGDDQYMIIFATDDVETIASRCQHIAHSIEDQLFGRKDLGCVAIRDAASVFAEGAVLDRDDDDARRDLPALNLAEPEASSIEPARQRQALDDALSDEARRARRANLLQMLEDDPEDTLTHVYMPIWHARERRIATFLCQPRRGRGRGARVGYDVLGHTPDAAETLKLDTFGIEECLLAMKKISDQGAAVNLMASVHFETLANRSTRLELQELLSAVPKRYGRLLILLLSNVPTGIPEARLTEVTGCLTNWVGNVAITIKVSECPSLQFLAARSWQYRRAKLGMVALDLENESTADATDRAKRFADVFAPRGLQLAAVNVPTIAAMRELWSSGYAYLSGAPVGPHQPEPELPRGFVACDLR